MIPLLFLWLVNKIIGSFFFKHLTIVVSFIFVNKYITILGLLVFNFIMFYQMNLEFLQLPTLFDNEAEAWGCC